MLSPNLPQFSTPQNLQILYNKCHHQKGRSNQFPLPSVENWSDFIRRAAQVFQSKTSLNILMWKQDSAEEPDINSPHYLWKFLDSRAGPGNRNIVERHLYHLKSDSGSAACLAKFQVNTSVWTGSWSSHEKLQWNINGCIISLIFNKQTSQST